MSLINIHSYEITSGFNKKAIPQGTDIQREIWFARHMDNCTDLMQHANSYTELLLVYGGKRKRGRRTNKPFFPIAEEVVVMPSDKPNYINFSCRHFALEGFLRYAIDPEMIRMFK